ncbi:MAG: aggregation factor core [Pseudomonadota bacterium]
MPQPMSTLAAAVAGAALWSTAATADIVVSFVESAPKDRFVIENTGACATDALQVTIDLRPAPAGLIFDTTAAGAGVEVFQPFEVARGADLLTGAVRPTDGSTAVKLDLRALGQGGQFAFTVDVDDTGVSSDLGQIRVSDAEIAGAEVVINGVRAAFDGTARARVPFACLS